MSKRNIYLLGLVTLLVFPIPAFAYLYIVKDVDIWEFLKLNEILTAQTVLGINFGVIYAFLGLLFMQSSVFDSLPNRVENLVRSMNLTRYDAVFLSICAGVGEELLFRTGIQSLCGVWITSIFFVAIHGYLNPKSWRQSLYGLIVLPFILAISFGYDYFGQWFSIGAHFSYDLVLFLSIVGNSDGRIKN